jgi:hypothetical protein
MKAATHGVAGGVTGQVALFGPGHSNGLPWLPDETLFSLCSRHHRVSLQVRAAATSEALFGDARAGRAHDFPDRIGAFVERAGGALGQFDDVIRHHTILPFYLPFRSAAIAAESIDALRGAGIGSLKFRLGLLTSRFRAHHPLKACSECIQEDREKNFAAYWHLAHQYPGVWLCPIHDTVLLESTLKATGVGRFLWHLPDEGGLKSPFATTGDVGCADRLIDLLREFATASIALASLPVGFHFDPCRLASANRRQLRERRLLRGSGAIDAVPFASSLSSFLAPLRHVPELFPLGLDPDSALSQARYLCSPDRALTHPLRHIGLALWLFGTWERFIDAYRGEPDVEQGQPTGNEHAASEPIRDERFEPFLRRLRDDGLSVTKAAAIVGIDTQTGLVWAARAGVQCRRRPKKLAPDVRQALSKDLRAGRDKKDVALQYGVSVQTVTTTLRTEVGLHTAWREARFASQLRKARKAWTQAAKKNPRAGVKSLRLVAAAAYAWLYRNDRSWLRRSTDSLPTTVHGNHASVDWDSRDLQVATAVEQTCALLFAETPGKRILLWRIYQRIPQLKALLGRLDRLPLTTAAISRALAFKPTTGAPLL